MDDAYTQTHDTQFANQIVLFASAVIRREIFYACIYSLTLSNLLNQSIVVFIRPNGTERVDGVCVGVAVTIITTLTNYNS